MGCSGPARQHSGHISHTPYDAHIKRLAQLNTMTIMKVISIMYSEAISTPDTSFLSVTDQDLQKRAQNHRYKRSKHRAHLSSNRPDALSIIILRGGILLIILRWRTLQSMCLVRPPELHWYTRCVPFLCRRSTTLVRIVCGLETTRPGPAGVFEVGPAASTVISQSVSVRQRKRGRTGGSKAR